MKDQLLGCALILFLGTLGVMFIERRINQSNGNVELWKCQWENVEGQPAKKTYLSKICDEQPIDKNAEGGLKEEAAICWSYGRTLGNIAVTSPELLGHFPGQSGDDAGYQPPDPV